MIFVTLVKPNAEVTKNGYNMPTKSSEISKHLRNNIEPFYIDSNFQTPKMLRPGRT